MLSLRESLHYFVPMGLILLDKTGHRRTMPSTEAKRMNPIVIRDLVGAGYPSEDQPDGQTACFLSIVLIEDRGDFPCY